MVRYTGTQLKFWKIIFVKTINIYKTILGFSVEKYHPNMHKTMIKKKILHILHDKFNCISIRDMNHKSTTNWKKKLIQFAY